MMRRKHEGPEGNLSDWKTYAELVTSPLTLLALLRGEDGQSKAEAVNAEDPVHHLLLHRQSLERRLHSRQQNLFRIFPGK